VGVLDVIEQRGDVAALDADKVAIGPAVIDVLF